MQIFKIGNKDFTLEDLYKEIYNNSTDRKVKLEGTFDTIKPFVTDIQSALQLLPEITNLQKVAVTNDDQLIKLAMILQKSSNSGKKNRNPVDDDGLGFELSEQDKAEIYALGKQAYEENIPGNSKS